VSSNRQLSLEDKFDQDRRFYQLISAVPGVNSVADVNEMPLAQFGNTRAISLSPTQTKSSAEPTMYSTAHSLIKTFGLTLVAGRDFSTADVEEPDPETQDTRNAHIIITEALAQRLFPDAANVVGKSVLWGEGADTSSAQIVGVVERLQTPSASSGLEGEYSVISSARRVASSPLYAIRAEPGQRDRVIAEVESTLRKAESVALRIKATTVEQDRKKRYGSETTTAWMLIVVSVLLTIITASGIVGMTSLWVNQRKKQIGVRRALGAKKIDILRYFITENLIIGSFGIASGALLAIGLNQFLASQLELSKLPLSYIGSGAVLFLLLGLVSAYEPSWRAAGISPAVATRGS
jgi:putative ABC transport system permease protein